VSKKYKGKICVYCAEAKSTSSDHVFARKFFLEADRTGLPQVPSCDPCNRAKSMLEHYLASLLPFGARHPGARANLELVPGRLAKNKRLHREIAAGWGQVWTKEGGIYLQTATVPTDSSRIEELFGLIVRGLIWWHWKTYLTSDHFVQVWALTDAGERLFEEHLFGKHSANQVSNNLGNGTACYEGKQGVDQPGCQIRRRRIQGEGRRLKLNSISLAADFITPPQGFGFSVMAIAAAV
jgi:hypothetical protein